MLTVTFGAHFEFTTKRIHDTLTNARNSKQKGMRWGKKTVQLSVSSI